MFPLVPNGRRGTLNVTYINPVLASSTGEF